VLDETMRDDGVNILLDVELIETSIVATPANANAQLVSVKTYDQNDPAVWVERIEKAAFGRSHVDPP